jgi:hypothetical protein
MTIRGDVLRNRILTVAAMMLATTALTACGGGGGGGGGPAGGVVTPPVPPPVTPTPVAAVPPNGLPVSDCAAKPNALSCASRTNVQLAGAYHLRQTRPGFPGGVLTETGVGLVAPLMVLFSSGAPTTGGDETITVGSSLTSATKKTFDGPLVGGSDALGGYETRDLGGGQSLRLYNFNQGSTAPLDYVLLYRFDGVYEPTNATTGAKESYAETMYGAYGQLAAPPRIGQYQGTATYAGQTRGVVNVGGTELQTQGALNLSLNFTAGVLSGRTSNTKVLNANGVVGAPTSPLDFVFRAEMSHWNGLAATASFTARAEGAPDGDQSLRGQVSGAFFGPSNGKIEEVGLTYALANATTSIYGVGGADLTSLLNNPIDTGPDCAGGSGAIVCTPRIAFKTLSGVSTSIQVPSSGAITRRIDRPLANVSATYLNNGPLQTSYSVYYGPSGWLGSGSPNGKVDDGLGSYATSVRTVGGLEEAVYLIDIDNVFANSLDYVQLILFERETAGGGAEMGFMPMGIQTLSADMPKTGSARFEGGTRGILSMGGGQFYTTASDIEMTANFATGAINGATFNFRTLDIGGGLNTLANNPNFTFTGSIGASSSLFSGTANAPYLINGAAVTGAVEGMFYGPAADEAGLVYNLANPTGTIFMQGGAVMGRKP